MSHHVTRGRRVVFGSPPRAAGAGARKRIAFPVGIIIRCFTIGTSLLRRPKNALSTGIRQGN
jgi:hypothetical protein